MEFDKKIEKILTNSRGWGMIKITYNNLEVNMEAKYTATRSSLFNFSFFICILLLVLGLIPGIIYILVKNLSAHSYKVIFYDDKYIVKSGIINTHEDESVFKGVLTVSINQSLKGKMFNFGDVKVDVVGKNNITLYGVKNPEALKKYLQSRKVDIADIRNIVTN